MSELPPENDLTRDIMIAVRANKTRFRNLGIALTVLGVLAIVFPLFFSIAAKVALGWLFLITGAFMLWHAFGSRAWQSALLSGIIAVLHLALGVYLAFFALTGLVGLTFLLGLIFLLQGGFEGVIAFQHRPHRGWGWLAVNAAVTVLLGVVLIAGLPGTALWAIGLLMGINFLTSGLAFLGLARAVG